MNNSSALKGIALAYNTLYKNTRVFDEIRESLDNKQNKQADELFDKEQIQQIEKAYKVRSMELERFSKELDKFEKFMPPSMYNRFKKAISDELFAVSNLMSNVYGYLELGDEGLLSSIAEKFDAEKETGMVLGKEMESFTNNLAFNLFMQVRLNFLTLEDLKLMALAFESDSILVDKIHNVITMLENDEFIRRISPELAERLGIELPTEKKEEPVTAAEVKPAEVKPVEATDGKKVDVVATGGAATATVKPETVQENASMQPIENKGETRKPTLQEKLAAVNYKLNGNINTEVQEISLESRLETVGAEIERLKSQEKRTIRDNFRLSQLLEEQVELQAYGATIGEQRLSRSEERREKGLKTTSEKLTSTEAELAEAKEIGEQYESHIMRFLSERYQQRLSNRIQRLQTKQGELTSSQKMSSIARFDKESGKIAKRARRKGNIAQLRAYRDQILNELESLGNDMIRFSSITEEKVAQMRNGTVAMLERIPSTSKNNAVLSEGITL